MSVREYLYVDQRRLNSYFEQIQSPVTYDKVPIWKAGLSLTGPNVNADQARFARPYTQHEKIEKFSEYVRKNREAQEVYISVDCQAKRVVIPPKISNSDFKGVVATRQYII